MARYTWQVREAVARAYLVAHEDVVLNASAAAVAASVQLQQPNVLVHYTATMDMRYVRAWAPCPPPAREQSQLTLPTTSNHQVRLLATQIVCPQASFEFTLLNS